MVIKRWASHNVELLALTQLELLDKTEVALPAPPPPPPVSPQPIAPPPTPPPATELPELPKLELSINPELPALSVTHQKRDLEIEMKKTEFRKVLKNPPPPKKTTAKPTTQWKPKAPTYYSAKSLDSQPRLINRPHVDFPNSLKRQGLWEGRVTLEVIISSTGRVRINRVISSSNSNFIPLAYSFASRARFTPPKKNGKSVDAKFNWPLVLRP